MARADVSTQAPRTRLYRNGSPGERWFFALLLVPGLLTALLVYTRGEAIETELRGKAAAAVQQAGVSGVTIEMSGRRATLLVPTGQSEEQALAAAETVEGIGEVEVEHVARTAQEAAACKDLQTKIDATSRGRGVSFSGSSIGMTGPGATAVRAVAKLLVLCPAASVAVEGYVDATVLDGGSVSLKRAKAVRAALIRGGVAGDRVQAKGFGDSYPLSPDDPNLNNRVAIVVAGE